MNSFSSTNQAKERIDFTYLTLLIGASLIRFVNLGFLDLQAWDEALYAVRAQAILRGGLWIDQTALAIDGLYSSLHPPLYVWGTAVAYQVLGISEVSSRLFSALSGAATVFAVYFLGKELHSSRTGVIAALLFSLTPFTLFYSRQGQFDALLVLLLTLAVLSIVQSMRHTEPHHSIMAGILVGCALMTKLFVGFGIPIVYALWILSTHPDDRRLHWKKLAILLLVGIGVAAPWHVYMMLTHSDGNPLFFFESSALVQRTLFGIEGNVKPLEILYYPNQLLVLFPFGTCAFLYWGWRSTRTRDPRWIFTTLWFLFFFAVFSLMRTKLAVYLLPMLVPASLLAGRTFEDLWEGVLDARTSRFIIAGTIFAVIWSAAQLWRDSVKAVISSAISLQLPDSSSLGTMGIFLLIVLVGCGLPLVLPRGRQLAFSRYFPSLVLLALLALSAVTVVMVDPIRYNDGATSFSIFANKANVRNILVAGYERNPQLTYYLRGADIGWQDDLHVRRIVPPSDTSLYSSWVWQEMIGEPASTLLLIEKDKFIRYRMIDPHSFLSESYISVFESRRYAGFVIGPDNFLASASSSLRNRRAMSDVTR